MSLVDITGVRFGRYTVVKRAPNDKNGSAMWVCRCDCGTEKIVRGASLRSGAVVSCGCFHKDDLKCRLTTHNMSNTRIREIWNCMKQRCSNPRNTAYKYYGGRGVSVCDEWKNDFSSFLSWALNNGYTDDLTLDRIDTNGNYEPSNCRWISRAEQQNNTRYVRHFTINGETKSLAEWCRIYGVPHERVRWRVVEKGWDILDALTTPPTR